MQKVQLLLHHLVASLCETGGALLGRTGPPKSPQVPQREMAEQIPQDIGTADAQTAISLHRFRVTCVRTLRPTSSASFPECLGYLMENTGAGSPTGGNPIEACRVYSATLPINYETNRLHPVCLV